MDTLRLKWTPTKIMGSSSAPPRPESVNMTDVYWDNRADVEAGSGRYNNNRDDNNKLEECRLQGVRKLAVNANVSG